MANIQELCMHCMQSKNGQGICPHCGYQERPQQPPLLPLRTVLQERYVVGTVLAENGEGASYIGWDQVLNSSVVIREFMPTTIAQRTGGLAVTPMEGSEAVFDALRRDFIGLSRSLARMRDIPALIPVYDIFETNGTAYSVSEHLDAVPLSNWLSRRGGHIGWEVARPLIMPLIAALSALHSAGVLHLAIAPENILVDSRGRFRLTGFSVNAAHLAHTPLAPQFIPGFAAYEQYAANDTCGAWTDVYGICGVLMYLLTGVIPKEAPKRVGNERLLVPSAVASTIPANVASAMAKGMRFDYAARTRTVEMLRDELSVSENVTGVLKELEKEEKKQQEEPGKPGKKSFLEKLQGNRPLVVTLLVATIVLFLACVGMGIVLAMQGGAQEEEASSAVSATSMLGLTSALDTSGVTSNDVLLSKKAPDTVGQNYLSIKNRTDLWPYVKLQLAGEVFDDSVPAGVIVKQEPEALTPIADGAEIQVYISKGPYEKSLTDVTSMDVVDAVADLSAQGFKCVVMYQESASVPANRVISTDPQPKTTLEYGSEVVLYVSEEQPQTSTSSFSSSQAPTSSQSSTSSSASSSSSESSSEVDAVG